MHIDIRLYCDARKNERLLKDTKKITPFQYRLIDRISI